jgi:hypothetical protein
VAWVAKILGCHYVADEATTYASYWARLVLNEFRAAGHQAQELYGSADNINGLTQALQSFSPDLVLFAGHGNNRIMTGSGIQPMIQACDNDQILEGRSVMFIACLTGLSLAGSIVSKGGQAVQAFVTELQFMTNATGNPSGDPYAASFQRTLIESARVVARGGSWADWIATFRRVSREEIARWEQNVSDPFASSVVMCLNNNLQGACIHGAGIIDSGDSIPDITGGAVSPIVPLIGVGVLFKVLV